MHEDGSTKNPTPTLSELTHAIGLGKHRRRPFVEPTNGTHRADVPWRIPATVDGTHRADQQVAS